MNRYEYPNVWMTLTFVEGHADSTFSNFVYFEPVRPIEANFMQSLHGTREWRWKQIHVYFTWPRWSPCLYMVKNFKKLIFWNQTPMTLKLGMRHWWNLIQHIVMYFQACSYSAYSMHSGERYRTNGPLDNCCVNGWTLNWWVYLVSSSMCFFVLRFVCL